MRGYLWLVWYHALKRPWPETGPAGSELNDKSRNKAGLIVVARRFLLARYKDMNSDNWKERQPPIEGVDRCFDNNSTALVFFEGTKLKLTARNGGSMNCEGLFHFIFRNTASQPSMLTKMTTQKINHIAFTGNNKKVSTINLSSVDQQLFITLAACLVNESKTLIK